MYKTTITESSRDFTKREGLKMCDTTDAIKMDAFIAEHGDFEITPVEYAVVHIENDRAENQEYYVYLIIDEKGDKYVTGSESFWNSFMDIWSLMDGQSEDELWSLRVYTRPSKNRQGKYFITCSIV